MAKIVGIQLLTAALIGGVLRRPEEGVIPCSRDEADSIVAAEQGEIADVEEVPDAAADAEQSKTEAAAAEKAAADAEAAEKAKAEAAAAEKAGQKK